MTDLPRSRVPFSRVVVGVDGSDTSDAALRWAAQRVRPGGTLHLVHVVGRASDRGAPPARSRDDWERRAGCGVAEGCDVTVEISDGDPAEVLLDEAATTASDLIVVGAHGGGGAGRWAPFLGSVTRSLLYRSDLPIIVHGGSAASGGRPVIGCVGYGHPADVAVGWAAAYAGAVGCPLELLHAVSHRPLFPFDSPIDMLGSYLGPDVHRGWAEQDLQELADSLAEQTPGLLVSTRVVKGSAVRAVISAATRHEPSAELVVIGRNAGPATSRLPVSPRIRQIIARGSCPTAVVPSCSAAT